MKILVYGSSDSVNCQFRLCELLVQTGKTNSPDYLRDCPTTLLSIIYRIFNAFLPISFIKTQHLWRLYGGQNNNPP